MAIAMCSVCTGLQWGSKLARASADSSDTPTISIPGLIRLVAPHEVCIDMWTENRQYMVYMYTVLAQTQRRSCCQFRRALLQKACLARWQRMR